MADVAPKDAKPNKAVGGKIEIDPALVELQTEGFVFREFVIRLPEAATLQDLNDPKLWRSLQGDRGKSLRKLDRVVILPFNEEWVVDAVVGAATVNTVTLAGIRKTDLPERYEILPETDDYKVKWAGSGYRVYRKRDGLPVSPILPTIFETERAMRNRYARAA